MSKSDLLLSSINEFYKDSYNAGIFSSIIHKGEISLRTLEWFITNYSKQRNVTYKMNDGKLFTVHCAYKSSLEGYSKKLFDPFCRAKKIDYVIPATGKTVTTTIAQLNLIKWVIKNNIIEYIKDNNLIDGKKTSVKREANRPCVE